MGTFWMAFFFPDSALEAGSLLLYSVDYNLVAKTPSDAKGGGMQPTF